MEKSEYRKVYLYASTIIAERTPFQVTTVLGSCVSICLWDEKLRIGGMNHYMLSLWNGEGLATPKFGNIAIEKLISRMIEMGSEKKNLQAKIFGGAEVLEYVGGEVFKIGEMNLKIAEEKLRKEKIAISAQSVGGKKGRKVIFYTDTGQVYMKFIDQGFPYVQLPQKST